MCGCNIKVYLNEEISYFSIFVNYLLFPIFIILMTFKFLDFNIYYNIKYYMTLYNPII